MKIAFSIGFLFIIYFNAISQDIHFSQPYASSQYLSPAFSGSTEGSRLAINCRNQWANYSTYLISYDHNFYKIKSGIGVIMYKDLPGNSALNSSLIGLQYAYFIPVTRFLEIRPAIQFSYGSNTVDYTKFLFKEQIVYGENADLTSLPEMNSKNYFDASAGLLVFSSKFWAGTNVDHLLMPDMAFSNTKDNMPLKFTVFGGKKFDISKSGFGLFKAQILTLTMIYKQQQKFRQSDLGFYWQYKQITLGMWYRGLPFLNSGYSKNNDALIFMTGYNLKGIKIAYSFDLTLSKLISYSGNAHEVSLVFEFFQNKALQKKKHNTIIPTPKF